MTSSAADVLPRALRPWAAQLRHFPADLALGLGPLVQRLALAIGPLRDRAEAPDGEVDGFDGLDRRGPYDRLLLSEWALAAEAPEEFVRRAAMGEHAFLRLARRQPGRTRRCIVLFDTGPDQLGGPRLAHLALWVALGVRAAAAGVAFGWGALQFPEADLVLDAAPVGVRRLLTARTRLRPTSLHRAAWAAILGGTATADDDVWIVGGEAAAGDFGDPPLARSVIVVRDARDPGVRGLEVDVRTRRVERSLALSLPEPDLCVRLLRDPFESLLPAPAPTPGRLSATSPLLFSADGRRLLVRRADGGLLALGVPTAPAAGYVAPRIFRPADRESIIAAGFAGRNLAVLTASTAKPDHVRLRLIGKRGGAAEDVTVSLAADAAPQGTVDGPFGPLVGHAPGRWLFLDARGVPFDLTVSGRVRPFAGLPDSVSAFLTTRAESADRLVVVEDRFRADGEARLAFRVPFSTAWRHPDEGASPVWASLFETTEKTKGGLRFRGVAGAGEHLAPSLGGLFAVHLGGNRWRAVCRALASPGPPPPYPAEVPVRVVDVHVPKTLEVVGITAFGEQPEPVFVVVEPGRRQLAYLSRTGVPGRIGGLPQTDSPIVTAATAAAAPVLAWLTEDGGVHIWSITRQRLLLRLDAAAPAGAP